MKKRQKEERSESPRGEIKHTDAEKSKNEGKSSGKSQEEEQVESKRRVKTPVSFLSSLPVTMATCQQPVRASCSLFPFLSRWQPLTEPRRRGESKIQPRNPPVWRGNARGV